MPHKVNTHFLQIELPSGKNSHPKKHLQEAEIDETESGPLKMNTKESIIITLGKIALQIFCGYLDKQVGQLQ